MKLPDLKQHKPKLDTKAIQIDKTQSKIIGVIVGATVVTVFCLVSSWALAGQALYQRKVINARDTSVQTLNNDITNAQTLASQYKDVFNNYSLDVNRLDASPPGDNGQLVLDALPTAYDFPALLTSVSKMLSSNGISSPSIGGTDQAGSVSSQPSGDPKPASIDLTVSGTGSYDGAKSFIEDLQRSIRPFDVSHLTLSGNESNLTITLDVTTYYQAAKTLNISGKEIR